MTMYFDEYGNLEWLKPEQFYAEPWTYLEAATGEDGERYAIVVIKGDNSHEIRYTII